MKKLLFLFVLVSASWGIVSNGDCFTLLGETYTVPEGSTLIKITLRGTSLVIGMSVELTI